MIETVLGPLPGERLGPTSMHEHLLCDASALGIPADPAGPPEDVVLDDADLAATELRRAGEAWAIGASEAAARGSRPVAEAPVVRGSQPATEAPIAAVVDPTAWGFGGPDPRLPETSRASGVAIVAGVGAYLPRTRPDWLAELDEEALHDRFLEALTGSLPGCDFRAGIVGMLAPGLPLPRRLSAYGGQASGSGDGERPRTGDDVERGMLRAGARAAAETGSAAIVRLDPRRRDGLEVLEEMAAVGLAPERVVFSNVDGYARDLGALRELAAAGATLKWCFGYEAPPRPGLVTATDAERADAVAALLAEGHRRQVLACGVWTKSALREYGGWGYDHLARTVVPALHERGLSESDLEALLVTEPRRLLDRPAPQSSQPAPDAARSS